MAKKKKNEDLPEGMSRRQAKLAARAAERAALDRDPRPYDGLAMEADLVALQEFVPSATAELKVTGLDHPVTLCTVLPGAVAAVVRENADGGLERLVALQVQAHSHNPGRDLAHALNWVRDAESGQTLESTIADGSQPDIKDLIDPTTTLEPTAHDTFDWWLADGAALDPMMQQGIQQANAAIMPSEAVPADVEGTVWWIDPGEKAHVRWVRPGNEDKLIAALARIGAAGELTLGEGTKFAGVFRTHGLAVPVFDLPRETAPTEFVTPLEELDKKIIRELDNDAPLTADERKQLDNIKSRQVTIR
ncbi:DUF5926 family protein [Corynebacterium sp. P7202]|uniref:DUF5926 family protein n=1 Tax=Corynebacterium pygosceleis TaxID=2800406 RepID=A0A9Q4C9Z9_9CORY|nr:DUF5926 family protein [Corynebacterium pygosceleis]MCK7638220.1 DUF5926 family protein [Corynebacterium pygosceleis]MCX7445779.1 DUF5926 family protein [Corynebacterium pygosceleis]MCX7469375.1 DUF5926 family protein [Corynebacterium pygosceleis]